MLFGEIALKKHYSYIYTKRCIGEIIAAVIMLTTCLQRIINITKDKLSGIYIYNKLLNNNCIFPNFDYIKILFNIALLDVYCLTFRS